MKLSQYFLPILKETPSEAQIASHRLMLRAGMVCQSSAGIYSWLPIGLRVLKKIEAIVREEMDKAGCHEMLMPTLQSSELWEESGRFEAYGKEMLRLKDRHDRDLLYSPTNEELVTDIFRRYVTSYKDSSVCLYQIQWKFRDEIRPRFGVMRGREFLMKDAYTFDLTREEAVQSYQSMFNAYLRTFLRMGVTAIPVKADPGAIGGDYSQEFQILAKTGESKVFYDQKLLEITTEGREVNIDELKNLYAAADEMHDPDTCPVDATTLSEARGIEVGHIFYFGDKYSKALNAKVMGPDGKPVYPEMGSYGIGISRLVGGIIEASHDDKGIVWPESVAPYKVGIINLKIENQTAKNMADDCYEKLQTAGVEVLYDDRKASAGSKFASMDLIGLPWQLIVGPRGAEQGMVELKNRATGEKQDVSREVALNKLLS